MVHLARIVQQEEGEKMEKQSSSPKENSLENADEQWVANCAKQVCSDPDDILDTCGRN